MPELVASAPTFLVNDVAASARWYETHLGFSASFFPASPPFVYASLQRGNVEIMLLLLEGYSKPEVARPAGVWDAYIRVEGLPQFYEEVRWKVAPKSGLTKRFYGDTEFEVTDPNGYILVFGERV